MRELAHHKVCLHRVLLFLVGVLQRYAQGVYDPYSRDQRQEVKHCVDVVLHHEAASPKTSRAFHCGMCATVPLSLHLQQVVQCMASPVCPT